MAIVGKWARFNDDHYRYAAQVVPSIMAKFRGVVKTHAELIQDHIRLNMNKPKSGRVYWRPGKRMHIASAPGEAPAIDTGRLYKDLKITYRDQGLTAIIGTSGTHYAEFLELGTRKMAKRPFATPAFRQYAEQFRYMVTLAAMS